MLALRRTAFGPQISFGVHFLPAGNGGDEQFKSESSDSSEAVSDELPYVVEIWESWSGRVECLVAVTADSTIGFAAYYAAAKEYPELYITLRHKDRVLARWNPPES